MIRITGENLTVKVKTERDSKLRNGRNCQALLFFNKTL